MRFGCDMDGVIYDWTSCASWMLNNEFGYNLPSEWTHWSHTDMGIERDHWKWLWGEGVKRGLFRHGHCLKGAFEALKDISKTWDIALITSRPKEAKIDTFQWVAFHEVPATELHILGSGVKKSEVRACDVYLDDHVDNCLDLAANTHGSVMLWTRPWNRNAQLPPTIERVGSWWEVKKHLLSRAL